MKFLIFGSTGQLGREVLKEVKKQRLPFVALSHEDIEITDHSAVRDTMKNLKPDIVLNCTAYNNVDRAELEPDVAFRVNSLAVRNLAECSREVGAILVHFSTDYVFDGTKGAPYTTNDQPNPINTYGKSKLEGELHIMDIMQRYFIIRVSWLFGTGRSNFPLKLLEMSQRETTIKVATDQINSPTYTVDAAKAIMELILKGKYGLYHLTNRGYCSRFEWATEILRESGWNGELLPARAEDFPSPARRPLFTVLDSSKFEKETGFSMPEWRDAVRRFIESIKRGNNAN